MLIIVNTDLDTEKELGFGAMYRPLCKKDCGNIVDGKHVETAQRLPSGKKSEWKENYVKHKQEDLYKIPEDLIKEILQDLI